MKYLLIIFSLISISFSSDFILFKDQNIKITSEEKANDHLSFIYFDLGNIKESDKYNSCIIEAEDNIPKNIFCIKKLNLETYFAPIDGTISKDGFIFINSVLFDLKKLDLRIKK